MGSIKQIKMNDICKLCILNLVSMGYFNWCKVEKQLNATSMEVKKFNILFAIS